mmetsp:Transcript_57925/g.156248  ORF Transcript_57925/g.156248 Transcript_57925/m.156248 type:complete len:242 (+) Transcript_57925:97-822(+)
MPLMPTTQMVARIVRHGERARMLICCAVHPALLLEQDWRHDQVFAGRICASCPVLARSPQCSPPMNCLIFLLPTPCSGNCSGTWCAPQTREPLIASELGCSKLSKDDMELNECDSQDICRTVLVPGEMTYIIMDQRVRRELEVGKAPKAQICDSRGVPVNELRMSYAGREETVTRTFLGVHAQCTVHPYLRPDELHAQCTVGPVWRSSSRVTSRVRVCFLISEIPVGIPERPQGHVADTIK